MEKVRLGSWLGADNELEMLLFSSWDSLDLYPNIASSILPLNCMPLGLPLRLSVLIILSDDGIQDQVSWVENVAKVRGNGDKSSDCAIFQLWSFQKADVIDHCERRVWRLTRCSRTRRPVHSPPVEQSDGLQMLFEHLIQVS